MDMHPLRYKRKKPTSAANRYHASGCRYALRHRYTLELKSEALRKLNELAPVVAGEPPTVPPGPFAKKSNDEGGIRGWCGLPAKGDRLPLTAEVRKLYDSLSGPKPGEPGLAQHAMAFYSSRAAGEQQRLQQVFGRPVGPEFFEWFIAQFMLAKLLFGVPA